MPFHVLLLISFSRRDRCIYQSLVYIMKVNHIITLPLSFPEKSILYPQGGKVFGKFFSLLSYFSPFPPFLNFFLLYPIFWSKIYTPETRLCLIATVPVFLIVRFVSILKSQLFNSFSKIITMYKKKCISKYQIHVNISKYFVFQHFFLSKSDLLKLQRDKYALSQSLQ